jgi:hypothetical protein
VWRPCLQKQLRQVAASWETDHGADAASGWSDTFSQKVIFHPQYSLATQEAQLRACKRIIFEDVVPHSLQQIKDAQLENGGRVTALPATSGSDVDDILGSE